MGDTELLPDTASLTALLATDFPMVLSDTVLPTALSDTVLAMLWPMPHPWSMPPLLSTMPPLPTLSPRCTLTRSPPTPTNTLSLTTTPTPTSTLPSQAMVQETLRAVTLLPFPTAG